MMKVASLVPGRMDSPAPAGCAKNEGCGVCALHADNRQRTKNRMTGRNDPIPYGVA